MNTLFQATAKFTRVNLDSGKEEKITENYLLLATIFGEAEEKIYKRLSEVVVGEFIVTKISKSTISEVISSDGERYYKGKIGFVILDESTGKSKRITQQVLVMADSVDEADEKIAEAFKDTTLGVEIIGVQESNIMTVFE